MNDYIEITDYTTQYVSIRIEKDKLNDKLSNLNDRISKLNELQQIQSNLTEMIRTMKNSPQLMKKYVNEIVKKIVIYPVKNSEIKFSNHASDKMIVIDMFLFTNDNPITYVINQRSYKILRLVKGEFNYKTFTLNCKNDKVLGRIQQIRHKIEIGLL